MKELEFWKDIDGYEGLYQISSHGRVKSVNRITSNGRNIKERILKFEIDKGGYLRLNLSKNGKREKFKAHRLVALHFIPNPEKKPEVNHTKGDKFNNYYKDLEWHTRQENIEHSFEEKLHSKPRKKVYCQELDIVFDSIMEAKRKLNIDNSSISKCCKGKAKYAGRHSITNEKLTWRYEKI